MAKIFKVSPGVYVTSRTVDTVENNGFLTNKSNVLNTNKKNTQIENKNNTYLGDELFEDYITLENSEYIELE